MKNINMNKDQEGSEYDVNGFHLYQEVETGEYQHVLCLCEMNNGKKSVIKKETVQFNEPITEKGSFSPLKNAFGITTNSRLSNLFNTKGVKNPEFFIDLDENLVKTFIGKNGKPFIVSFGRKQMN